MMKNIIKTIAILAITVLTLAGCATNNETEFNVNEVISEVLKNTSTATTSEVEEPTTSTTATSTVESEPVESSTTSTIASEPTETTSTPEVKEETSKPTASTPVETPKSTISTSSTIASKPVEKPATSSKPVEKPTTSKPTSSTTTSTTSSKPVEKPTAPTTPTKPVHTHNFINGKCNCGKVDPNYVAPHNCETDCHIYKDLTKTTTEEVEIEEIHLVVANGFDRTLAEKYFNETCTDFAPYLGTNAYGEGSTAVKTTGTKTITTFYHECTECGYTETYDTKEEVIPGETWEFVNRPRSKFFPVVWYDINNIPAEILEGREKEKAYEEDVWASF